MATTESTALTAGAQALNTVELLEKIILELPCQKVLPKRRVSTLWNDTIAGSIILRTALFLKPANGGKIDFVGLADQETASTYLKRYEGTKTETTLAAAHCATPSSSAILQQIAIASDCFRTVVSNPLLVTLHPDLHYSEEFKMLIWKGCDLSTFQSYAIRPPRHLMEMYLTQPPASSVKVGIKLESTGFGTGFRPGFDGSIHDKAYFYSHALLRANIATNTSLASDGTILSVKGNKKIVNHNGVTVADLLICDRLVREACEIFTAEKWGGAIAGAADVLGEQYHHQCERKGHGHGG